MATTLRRVNPRSQLGWSAGLLVNRSETSASGYIDTDYLFGLVAQVETGQGAQTSDITGDVVTADDATISTGQGSQTSDIVADVLLGATITTGQGSQTSDLVVDVPISASIETGQGAQSSDISADVIFPTIVRPRGWHDAANEVVHPGAGLWQANPRKNALSAPSLVVARDAYGALGDALADAAFTAVPWSSYYDGIGSPSLSELTRYITAAGGDAFSTFGVAEVSNKNRTLVVPGISSDEGFGHAEVIDQRQYVSTTGMLDAAFGTPYLENVTKIVEPSRIDPLGVGDHVIIGPRYFAGFSAGDNASLGAPEVIGARYLVASAIDPPTETLPSVVGGERTVSPTGIAQPDVQVSLGAVLNDNSQSVYPDGIYVDDDWNHIIGNDPLSVIEEASAGNDGSVPDPDVLRGGNSVSLIRPYGLAAGAMGAFRTSPAAISPRSINGSAIGRPWVSNYIRYVLPRPVAASRYGKTWVSNYIRYVVPTGFDHSVVWDDFGPITADGGAARVYNVASDVVLPAGINGLSIGSPTVIRMACRG